MSNDEMVAEHLRALGAMLAVQNGEPMTVVFVTVPVNGGFPTVMSNASADEALDLFRFLVDNHDGASPVTTMPERKSH